MRFQRWFFLTGFLVISAFIGVILLNRSIISKFLFPTDQNFTCIAAIKVAVLS